MTESFRPHHVGWAVADLAGATTALLGLGYRRHESLSDATDESFRVRLRFLSPPGGSVPVELVAPAGDGSAVGTILGKSGPGPYHAGYCVDDLAAALRHLRAAGFRPVGGARPAPAFGGREIQFLHHPALGLIELIAWPE